MIILKNKYTIKNPGEVQQYRLQNRTLLIKFEEDAQLSFVIPNRFKNNSEKTTYKVGFLSEFLSEVYPLKTYNEICDILNFRYHIFLGRRQIERLTKAYNSSEKYLN